MNAGKKLVPLFKTASRAISQSAQSKTAVANELVTPKLKKLQEIQKQFQVDDNVPVYIKRGAMDKMLFGLTCVLTAVSLAMSAETLYTLANK